MGARATAPGLDAVQVHMTNTRNTPVEAFERLYPVRVESLAIRSGSGGHGRHRGGHGLRKAVRFLVPVTLTVLTERRTHAPAGVQGGQAGALGVNTLVNEEAILLPGKGSVEVAAGSLFVIETPAGGGFGHE